METLRQDFVAAVRSLERNPGFSAVIILTLALAIGPLTAIFSVVDAVLIRPLPFREPDRVVQIWSGEGARPHGPTSSANFADWRAMNRSFEAIAAEDFAWYNLTSDDDGMRPERLRGAVVSPSFFQVVGVHPVLGRGLAAVEERPDTHAAVVSYGLWMRRFAGDRHLVGRDVLLNGERWRIVGVMPRGFAFPGPLVQEQIDLWAPLAWSPNELDRGMRRYGVTARLRAGITLAQAQADVDHVAARLAADYPQVNAKTRIRLVPVHDELASESERPLLLLLGAVAMLLLVACANAANLMLARAGRRHQEMSIRVALGAGRGRVIMQLLTESLLLAMIAAGLGLLAGAWIIALYNALIPAATRADVSLDWRVLGFLLGVAIFTGLTFGSAPAWRASLVTLGDALRRSGRSTTASRTHRRFSSALVVFEIGTAVLLLVTAGLLLRSFDRLTGASLGFDPRDVYVTHVALTAPRYPDDARSRQFTAEGIGRLASIRGVTHAGAIDYLPFGQSDLHIGMTIEGRESAARGEVSAHYRAIAGDYLGAMRIPLRRGRVFDRSDGPRAPFVALVNAAMAQRYWPDENPIGRRIRIGSPTDSQPSPWMTVIGVVGDVKHWSFAELPEPMLYASLDQQPARSFTLVARLDGGRSSTLAAVRDVLFSVDPQLPMTWRPLRELLDSAVAEPRFRSVFTAAFSILALILATVGLYGLISFGVTERTRELGVRVALGARHTDIVNLVLGQGMRLAVVGVTVGLAGAFMATRLLRGMLYQVSTTDWVTFVTVVSVLVTTAAIANYLPARRASRIDPLAALGADG